MFGRLATTIEIFWPVHLNPESSFTSQQTRVEGFCNSPVRYSFDTLSTTIWHKPVDPILWQIWQHKLASVGLCHSGAIVVLHYAFLLLLAFTCLCCKGILKLCDTVARVKGKPYCIKMILLSCTVCKIHSVFSLRRAVSCVFESKQSKFLGNNTHCLIEMMWPCWKCVHPGWGSRLYGLELHPGS